MSKVSRSKVVSNYDNSVAKNWKVVSSICFSCCVAKPLVLLISPRSNYQFMRTLLNSRNIENLRKTPGIVERNTFFSSSFLYCGYSQQNSTIELPALLTILYIFFPRIGKKMYQGVVGNFLLNYQFNHGYREALAFLYKDIFSYGGRHQRVNPG